MYFRITLKSKWLPAWKVLQTKTNKHPIHIGHNYFSHVIGHYYFSHQSRINLIFLSSLILIFPFLKNTYFFLFCIFLPSLYLYSLTVLMFPQLPLWACPVIFLLCNLIDSAKWKCQESIRQRLNFFFNWQLQRPRLCITITRELKIIEKERTPIFS